MRPRYMAIIFVLCLAVVLAAMGWMSATVLRLHEREVVAKQQADVEERVRLALWRMDSVIATLIARENGRPYFAYSSFYPVERAYTAMFAPIEYGEVLVPSPVLVDESLFVQLYFQFGPDGELTSPQAPTGEMRDLAEARYISAEQIKTAAERLERFRMLDARETLVTALPIQMGTEPPRATAESREQRIQQSRAPQAQQARSSYERSFRKQQNTLLNQQQLADNREALPFQDVVGGAITPVWRQDHLLLARRVRVNGAEFVQGCQLDWPAIRSDLLARVTDLLPDARLEPVPPDEAVVEARQLATLPVRLVPGALAVSSAGESPLVFSLILAWVCFLLAAIAIGVLLAGALSLSERRGAFVSAVTHELRTPLTAFRLYTDMLADQTGVDAATRQRYVGTLRQEAGRLQHLVENVLAYARLERGRRAALEHIRVGTLLDRIRDPLEQRAAQAGLKLTFEVDEATRAVMILVDPSAVERILYNLTDNACKYARGGTKPVLSIEATHADHQVVVRVRDYGPGISLDELRRLFRPFHKSARDAAHSAPGVGLGLSLSRGLARGMGGDLTLDRIVRDGACFILTLPKRESG